MELEIFFDGKKRVNARMNDMIIKTDQPVMSGGDGSAPAPFDLFLASIGTCAGIYVKGFCDSRGLDSSAIRIIQKHKYNKETRLVEEIELEARLPEDFPEKYKQAIINAMDLCAVKRHLKNPPRIATSTTLQ
jgi:ribosomal protein S12 methylthiotransferase accessory factor